MYLIALITLHIIETITNQNQDEHINDVLLMYVYWHICTCEKKSFSEHSSNFKSINHVFRQHNAETFIY